MQIKVPFTWLQPDVRSFLETGDVQLVCEFTDSAKKTVRRWAANETPAKGGKEIRLWHFLLAAGYEFPELRIPEYNFYLAQLYAYSVVTIDEVVQLCGVKNDQTALQIMRGQPPMHPMPLDDIKDLYDAQLQVAKNTLQQKLHGPVADILPPLPEPSAAQSTDALKPDVLVSVLASLLVAIAPLTELVLDDYTPEQRSDLRKQVGDPLMFRLSNDFNALCSERARANQGRR